MSELLPPTGALSHCCTSLLVKKVFLMTQMKLSACSGCPSFFMISHYQGQVCCIIFVNAFKAFPGIGNNNAMQTRGVSNFFPE